MFCRNCGAKISDSASFCTECGASTSNNVAGTVSREVNHGEELKKLLVPVNVSGLALTAGWLGFMAFIPILGQLAILFGILALRSLSAHPEKSGKFRAWVGIVVGAFWTILWSLIVMA